MRGIRTRLALTLLALVAVTVTAISVGTYAFVEARLRESLLADAVRTAQFDLSVLIPGADLPPDATRVEFEASGLKEAFLLRSDAGLIVDFGDDDPFGEPTSMLALIPTLPAGLQATVDAGSIGYAWQ